MDENQISVMCEIDGCFARVIGAPRCFEHGGLPTYEWHPSEWGGFEVFRDRTNEPIQSVTSHPLAAKGQPS